MSDLFDEIEAATAEGFGEFLRGVRPSTNDEQDNCYEAFAAGWEASQQFWIKTLKETL